MYPRPSGGMADAPHSKCGIERCVGSSPTSGTCFPWSGACGLLGVHKLFTYGPLWGPFLLAGAVAGRLLLWLGQRCCCSLIHGQERLEPHDLPLIGDQIFLAIAVGSRNGTIRTRWVRRTFVGIRHGGQ